MGAAHFRGVDVSETMGAELAISFAINRARDHHPRVGGIADAANIVVRIGRVAHQHELQRGVHGLERLPHF